MGTIVRIKHNRNIVVQSGSTIMSFCLRTARKEKQCGGQAISKLSMATIWLKDSKKPSKSCILDNKSPIKIALWIIKTYLLIYFILP